MSEQAGGGLPTECETGPGLCLSQPADALRMAGEQLWEALGKNLARAGWVAAVEAPNLQLQPDGLAAGRQIGGSSPIPAMDRGADRPRCWAARVIALRTAAWLARDHPDLSSTLLEREPSVLLRNGDPRLRNRRGGINPYDALYKAWAGAAEFVLAPRRTRRPPPTPGDLLSEDDFAGIDDVPLRHQVGLVLAQTGA